MRTRPALLRKTCPFCGGGSYAQAKLPIPANLPEVEYNLDELATLVEKESIGLLLALVELLPYKNFTCRKCRREFMLESRAAKELALAMLASMKPVIQSAEPRRSVARPVKPTIAPPSLPTKPLLKPATPEPKYDWEAESLDALFDDIAEADRE